MNGDTFLQALLGILASALIGQSIQAWYVGDPISHVGYLFVAGLAFGAVAYYWRKLAPIVPFAPAARAIATSVWTWGLLVLGVFIWGLVSSTMLTLQRDHSAQNFDRISKIIEDDMVPFRLALRRWLVPRHLSLDQITNVIAYIKSVPRQTLHVRYEDRDQEAIEYANDFTMAFSVGGWTMDTMPQQGLEQGLSTSFRQTTESEKKHNTDPEYAGIDTYFERAIKAANIFIDGSSSSGSGQAETEDRLTLMIGPRRRDDNASYEDWRRDARAR